jgi:hypothetical protein
LNAKRRHRQCQRYYDGRGYRFFFYSADLWEPAHIHVYKDSKEVKVWLHDMAVAVNFGFAVHELNEIVKTIRTHRDAFMEAWNDHSGS